jgi:ATP adenylyltransferase
LNINARNKWTIDKPFAFSPLPFANHVRRLAPYVSASATTRAELETALIEAFLDLLELCISTVRHAADYPAGPPSYNVVLTLRHMYVFPRVREAHVLAASREPLGVNALGFAGLLLVKSQAELEAVGAEGPGNVLRGVACESVHEMQVMGGPELDGDVGAALA